MVYRPLTPPEDPNRLNRLIANYEDDKRRWKLEISVLSAWRFLILGTTLACIILWLIKGVIGFNHGEFVLLVIWLFAVVFWNLFCICPSISKRRKGHGGGARIPGFPTIVCQVGPAGCVINGDDDDDDDGSDEEGGRGPKKPKKKIPVAWIVDIVFGVIILIVVDIAWRKTGWRYQIGRESVNVLLYIIGSFEIVAGVLSLFSIFRNYVMEVGIVFKKKAEEDNYYRIRLPVDNDRRTAGGTAVSVSA